MMCRTLLVSDPVFADSSTHCNDIVDVGRVHCLRVLYARVKVFLLQPRRWRGCQISDAAAGKAAPIRLGVTKVVTPGLLHLRPVKTNPQLLERATPAVEELTLYY